MSASSAPPAGQLTAKCSPERKPAAVFLSCSAVTFGNHFYSQCLPSKRPATTLPPHAVASTTLSPQLRSSAVREQAFWTRPDPTHGYIKYVSEAEAMQLGLYKLQGGAVRFGSLVGKNQPVKSIRLQSSALLRWATLRQLTSSTCPQAKGHGLPGGPTDPTNRHHRDREHQDLRAVDPAHELWLLDAARPQTSPTAIPTRQAGKSPM